MKTLVGIITVVAILGGSYYFFTQNSDSGQMLPTDEHSGVAGTIPEGSEAPENLIGGDGVTPDEEQMENKNNGTEDAVVINYTDSGFEPQNVEISRGTTITFRNNSSRTMWPASAQHPTHTVYDDTSLGDHCSGVSAEAPFDSCKALGSGTEYSFTFNKTGQWGYHNHVNAQHVGGITVQ